MPEFKSLPERAKLPYKKNFAEDFPIRSPGKTAHALRKMLKGKTICDVGCAKGDMVMAFSRFAGYAYGINSDHDETKIARDRGVHVLLGDALEMDVPGTDFYFIYWAESVGTPFIQRMMESQPGPFTILCSGFENSSWLQTYIKDWGVETVYTFPYVEHSTTREDLAPAEGTWWLVPIVKKR